jgi:hypothetical protein
VNTACAFTGCDRPVQGRGLCTGHYQQQKRGAVLTPLRKIARGSDRIDWRGSVLPHAVGIVESYDTVGDAPAALLPAGR